MSDEMPFASIQKAHSFFANIARVNRPQHAINNAAQYAHPATQGPLQQFVAQYTQAYVDGLTTENGNQDGKSIREGLAGLAAQDANLVAGPLTRGPDGGIDFYDSQHRPFDVKTAPPGFGGNLATFINALHHELETSQNFADDSAFVSGHILLCTSFLTNQEHAQLWQAIGQAPFQRKHRRRIQEVHIPFAPNQVTYTIRAEALIT